MNFALLIGIRLLCMLVILWCLGVIAIALFKTFGLDGLIGTVFAPIICLWLMDVASNTINSETSP